MSRLLCLSLAFLSVTHASIIAGKSNSCRLLHASATELSLKYNPILILGEKDLLHASCSVKWTLSEQCESAQEKIITQMNLWDNEDCGTKPGDTTPNGQKCLYHHTGSEGLITYGTHTTPIHRYVDDLTFTFIPKDYGCLVDAFSQSETLSLLDYGTNYCNLFNLMDGSGLVQDSAYTEDTNDFICTQHSTADCDIY